MTKSLRGSIVVLVLAAQGVACDLCGNRVLSEYASPDGQQKIVVFRRDCGATTGLSRQASLVPSDQREVSEGRNVFAADDVELVFDG